MNLDHEYIPAALSSIKLLPPLFHHLSVSPDPNRSEALQQLESPAGLYLRRRQIVHLPGYYVEICTKKRERAIGETWEGVREATDTKYSEGDRAEYSTIT